MAKTKNQEFATIALNEQGVQEANNIAASFDAFLEALKVKCLVNSREFALAKTHLETASFYAKKAMCLKPANQKEGA
jgi:hypothetical protein